MVAAGEIGYWLYWALGLLFLLGCSGLTWWGLFGDRARGRRRCPRCWYDLSHSAGRACPECGREARHERHLHRSRRRLLPAAAGALAASVGVTWVIEQNRSAGWMSMIPTRVLLAALPVAGGRGGLVVDEIELRCSRRLLTPEQWQTIVNRCIAGDFRSRPAGDRWQDKYSRLLDLADGLAPTGTDFQNDLLALPPYLSLESDRAWPAGVSPCLQLQLRHWWPPGTECRVELVPEWQPTEPLVFTRANPRSRSGYSLVVPADAAADGRVRFDATVLRRAPGPDGTAPGQWQTVLARPIDVPIRLARRPLEEVLVPESDPVLLEAVTETFSLGVVKWPSGPAPVRVRFDPAPTYRSAFDGLAIGASVEIRRDGELARRLDIWWRAGTAQGARGSGFRVDYENAALVGQADEDDGRWQMTVRGVPELALRAGEADRYWAGEFTIPLKVERHRRPASPRDWETTGEDRVD